MNNSILETIGNTPLVRLNRIGGEDSALVLAKMESFNPGGSVKDRIALNMIETAERQGLLRQGMTIVEPTSGNTGIGLALVSAVKGYKLVLTMPDSMSIERRQLLSAYGAELVLTPKAEGMSGAIQKAEEMARLEGHFMPQQFLNPANPLVHRLTTGEEIAKQLEGLVLDFFVAGVGTGGTISGAGETLKGYFPGMRSIAVEPAESPVLSGGKASAHKIQGIGAGFVPGVYNPRLVDEVRTVRYEDAAETSRRLAREEGILVGVSAGANTYVALQVAREAGRGKTVVVVLPDTGERYLSTGLFGAAGDTNV
jgi:cysteine synthase A